MAMMSTGTKILTEEDVALLVRVERLALSFDGVDFCSADRVPGEKAISLRLGVDRSVGRARKTWLRAVLTNRVEQQGWTPNIRILLGSCQARSSNVESSD